LKKLIFSSLLLLLTACQTQFPILTEDSISEKNSARVKDSDTSHCQNQVNSQKISTADYLLQVNKMVDAMVQSNAVHKAGSNQRLRIYLSPISAVQNNAVKNYNKMDSKLINQAIKNRVQRSGQFVLMATLADSEFQLSGNFGAVCSTEKDELSLQLHNNMTKQIIWSKTQSFK
jgi:hypothetical protein